jgi:hypothetical protein
MSSVRLVQLEQPAVRTLQPRMSYPDFPIARRIRSNAHDFQLAFGEEAATRAHERFEDAFLQPDRTGLLILGRHEQALSAPTAAIRALYPWKLEVGIPCIRYKEEGDLTLEPVMQVTVDLPRGNAQAVHLDLAGRADQPVNLEFAYDRATLRTRARLAALLGYALSLESFTGGDGKVSMWLSGWVPVVPEGPEGPGGPVGPAAA